MDVDAAAHSDAGFSLVELLVATLIILLVLGGTVALVNPAGHLSAAEPESIDMQQRARVGAESISRDLYMAGAGLDGGPGVGALGAYLPPILPRRIGATGADAPNVARSDALTLIWVPATAVETTLLVPLSGTAMTVRQNPGCPIGQPSCGAAGGMGMLLFDAGGNFDLFTVLTVDGPAALLRHRGRTPSYAYGGGAFAAEVEARTYYFDANNRQLREYDTDQSDAPVIDDVTELQVEYFGSPDPPVTPRPRLGESNCLYDNAGNLRSGLATLSAGPDGQAALPLAMLADGPWCGSGDAAFDVDLLRVRRVRVRIRVQASSAALRGTGAAFAVPGTSRSVWSGLSDLVVTLGASPRNLNLDE